MKLIDDLLDKFGTDKILHFLGGYAITSTFMVGGIVSGLFGVIITAILSYAKEYFFDDEADKQDIYAALIGSGISLVFGVLAILI